MEKASARDFTPTGLKLEGAFENDRNTDNHQLFAAIIKEVYGADQCICAHHLTYVAVDKRVEDGHEYEYQIVEEIPAADTLIFDHVVAKCIWGNRWQYVLSELALLPVPERDDRLAALYNNPERQQWIDDAAAKAVQ